MTPAENRILFYLIEPEGCWHEWALSCTVGVSTAFYTCRKCGQKHGQEMPNPDFTRPEWKQRLQEWLHKDENQRFADGFCTLMNRTFWKGNMLLKPTWSIAWVLEKLGQHLLDFLRTPRQGSWGKPQKHGKILMVLQQQSTRQNGSSNLKEKTMSRPSWDDYFLNIANVVAERSTCLRAQYGAVIVDNYHTIISTGYNGAPVGMESCYDRKLCFRIESNIPSGERYETCQSVHAEANAIARSSHSVRGCKLYIGTVSSNNCVPCEMCKRLMTNAGISMCIFRFNGDIVCAWPKDLAVIDRTKV